ncbi:MAG: lipoyl(octanoyl) transferase LipB [Alistipes sp.]|jgi:lipoyl(octanoyl) transferase|nr:lipoyl(octanoyl) transferase LipB [Alistipes sp.]
MKPWIEFADWGVIDYGIALKIQCELFDRLVESKEQPTSDKTEGAGWLVFCEHPHVYTLGRSGRDENLLVSEDALRAKGAVLYRTERGGDITYHGPGQIVGYPIVNLERLDLGLREYIGALEQAVIETLARFGILAGRVSGKTGVWVGLKPREEAHPSVETDINDLEVFSSHRWFQPSEVAPRKICAIGVRASRGVVMHGFALNVSTDLKWFDLINPCGFVGGAVTSMERETEEKIALDEVKRLLRERLSDNLKIII